MPLPIEPGDTDIVAMVRALQIDVGTSLALSRVALRALAALSSEAGRFVDEGLEAEINSARSASGQSPETLENLRADLHRAAEEADRAFALEHALVRAADALGGSPSDA
jgi:hypothetical protein